MADGAQSSTPDKEQEDEKKEQAAEKKVRFIEPQPMREDQVQNAVNFLSHPKVKGSPVVYRRSFLERKGLTKEEIDEAFRRVPDPPSSAAGPQESAKPPAAPQPQAPVQSSLQQLQMVPVPRKGVRWSQIVLAIGLLSAAGAGAALVTKNYLYPKLKAWLRHVVLNEGTEKPKPAAESEASKIAVATASAAAATAAAAAAASEMATIAKELMAFRKDDHRYMDGLLKSLEARDQEIKATLDALLELQRNTRLLKSTDASVNKGYINQGTEGVKLSSGPGVARSVRPLTSSPAAASTNPPHSPSYMEVLAMVERGEKPPGIREVQDKPPNANQAPSGSLFNPKPKPWETSEQSNGSESVPWWRQKADTSSVRITELDDKVQGQSSNGRGWVPPPAPKPVMPGVDAAIRYRSQKSPPPTPDAESSVSAARYHEMNGDSASTVTDKSVDPSNGASSEPEVYKEATQEEQQLYEVGHDERQQQEQQESEIQRQQEVEIQQQEDEIQKQQEAHQNNRLGNVGLLSTPLLDLRTDMAALPASTTGSDWWDAKIFSGPVVVKHQHQPLYRMYYYGRGGDQWNFGVRPFSPVLPTGRIGCAESDDGLQFRRVRGPLAGGAVFDPSEEPEAFDSVHIAVGDVVVMPSGEWWMYYFGGGMEEGTLLGTTERHRGLKLQTGLAVSRDGGLSFGREAGGKPILGVGDGGQWDCKGTAWPRVLPPSGPRRQWLMTYHTRESDAGDSWFVAGVATSSDGVTWEKRGKVLGPGQPGAWDDGGVSVRHVVADEASGQLLMFYEGSNRARMEFAIGLATSQDGGLSWRRDDSCGPEPGGPVLRAKEGDWDSRIVGTPYVLRMPDGTLRMYYLGVGTSHGIGVAVSNGSDFRKWSKVVC